ncbi:hypothetical protein H4Q32_014146 [Labeo rohita]|uniref:ribonuclease H n=1 Tax=Labeo rohita TaxID=84645 RepID=A0ABQ8LT20_LABRO|nr:hypothetical protein H4Q32_014146 [Labeo rohita]
MALPSRDGMLCSHALIIVPLQKLELHLQTLWGRPQRKHALNHMCNQSNREPAFSFIHSAKRSCFIGTTECGYRAISRVEQTLESYLSPEAASSLKAPVLPSKPLRTTSALVGKGYLAAGQAGACLHTMAVLQAYQVDLLKELDDSDEISRDDISELRRAADLSLHATKEAARAIGRSMAAMVAAERHLWLTLSDMKEKDRVFLLDAPACAFWPVRRRRQFHRRQVPGGPRRSPQRSGPDGRAGPLRAAPAGEGRVALHSTVSVSPQCPQETIMRTLPVFQDAVVSGEPIPQFLLPGNVAELGSSPPLRGSLEQLVRSVPAGVPLQGTELAVHTNPEAGLERLVPLVDYLAPWKLLPNVSAWVLRTVERGYRIQFGAPPPPFNGVRAGSGNRTGSRNSVEEGGHRGGPSSRQGVRVLQPVLHCSEEGWGPASHFRSESSESFSYEVEKFKMLTVNQVVSQIRKFLRFAFRGEAYQYRVIPFGLALSPRTFTKCVDAALAPLRLRGIRILNYIDDWLILAQSEHMAVQHRDVEHMKELGLRLNARKSVLSPLQRTTYLGMVWDSTTMQARLSPARIESILTAVTRVKEGRVTHCKAVPVTAGSDGSCVQRDTFWPAVHETPTVVAQDQGALPEGKPVPHDQGYAAMPTRLRHVEEALVPVSGPGVRSSLSPRNTSDCDASLTSWGAVMSGHPARGLWSGRHLTWHINCLEMLAVFRALKHFLPDLIGRHVLVRTDNTAVVYYINHQGGLHLRPLYKLAHQILVWSQNELLSLRAVHVPGHLSMGADILSRQGPRPGEWMLHPEVVKQIWRVFGQAQMDLFATQENVQCPHWFSLTHSAPLELDAMVQTWLRLRLYAFPPIALLPGVLERVHRNGVRLLLVAPYWLARAWFLDLISLLDGSPWEIPVRRDLLSQTGGTILHPRPELWKLWSSLHEETVRPEVRPTWDLAVVLEALCRPPFEPIEESSNHHLSVKTVLLLALTSLKTVGDLQALSVAPSHIEFAPGMAKAFLYPRPGVCPEGPLFSTTAHRTPGLLSSSLSGSGPAEAEVRALDTYVHRAALWRKSDQLFICYGPPKRGLPASKHTLSRWIVDAITQAYEFSDLPSPLGVKAHSTRGISASKAFMPGVPMQDICDAAGWSTPLTFVRFYDLDLRVAPGSSTQLELLKGNVSGYDCNPGSPKGTRRCVSCHTSCIPASVRFFLKLNAGSGAQRPYAEGVPKAFVDGASHSIRGTRVTVVT